MRPARFATLLTVPVLFLCGAGVAVPLAGQQAEAGDPDRAVSGGGALPAGWSARTDGQGDLSNVKFVSMGKGYHLTLGPATILYREGDEGTGSFHAVATFTQTKAPPHPEGYGLFFGGKGLNGDGQQYTYFLVRGDGKYLIKRREGERTTNVTPWTAHPAIKAADAKGQATNLVEIDAKRDAGKVVFKVNGQSVHTADTKSLDIDGIVGIRVNHNLDLHIDGFGVHR